MRPFTAGDAGAAAAFYGDPEVMAFMGTGALWTRDGDAFEVVRRLALEARDGLGTLALVEREGGALIGHAMLRPLHGRELEVGWLLRRDRWGRGLGTELARALVAAALARAPVAVARIHPAHRASQRVARAAGLEPAGWQHAHGVAALRFEARAPGRR